MSRIVEKKHDPQMGQVIVTIEDDNGVRSVHTFHVLGPDGKEEPVKEKIQQTLDEVRIRAKKVRRLLRKHGWKP